MLSYLPYVGISNPQNTKGQNRIKQQMGILHGTFPSIPEDVNDSIVVTSNRIVFSTP